LQLHVPKAKPVFSYFQILGIFLIFSFVLYIAFQGDKIKDLALNESKNIDLAIIYLKQIVVTYPEDIENWERLLLMYLKQGDKKRAFELVNEMEKSKNKDIQNKSIYLKYSFLKEQLLQTSKDIYKNELIGYYNKLIKLFEKEPKKLEVLYKDYLSFGLPNISMDIAKKLFIYYYRSNEIEKSKLWLNEFYRQALATSNSKAIFEYYEIALKLEPDNYTLKEKIAETYSANKEYDKAIKIYLDIANNIDTDRKKYYVLKIVKLYQWENQYDEAARFLKNNENLFLHKNEDKKMILRLYLSLGKLDYARDFAYKMLIEDKYENK